MAQEIQIPNAGSTAKIRHPLAVVALTLITLGIYGIFWWYFINREMADYGEANGIPELGDNPILSVIALTFGALIIIPALVTIWRTCKRIEIAQNHALGSNNFSVLLTFILWIIPLLQLIAWFLMQSNLNQVWERLADSRSSAAETVVA